MFSFRACTPLSSICASVMLDITIDIVPYQMHLFSQEEDCLLWKSLWDRNTLNDRIGLVLPSMSTCLLPPIFNSMYRRDKCLSDVISWISSVEHRICPCWTNSTLYFFFFFFNVALKKNGSLVFPSNLEQGSTSEVAASVQKKLRPTLFQCSRGLVIRTGMSVAARVVGWVITLHTHPGLLLPSVFSNVLAHLNRWFF